MKTNLPLSRTLVPGKYESKLTRIASALREVSEHTYSFIETLPFSLNDTTVGVENEFQGAVIGDKTTVDLPLFIENSNYFQNIKKRAGVGETSKKPISELERYLNHNPSHVWENSWIRLPLNRLNSFSRKVFMHDLLADKKNPSGDFRSDSDKFLFTQNGVECIRIPISYLLKIALSDAIGGETNSDRVIFDIGLRLTDHFFNDNTSPEVTSFYISSIDPKFGSGRVVAKETTKRFLLIQLLTIYANKKFGLEDFGQKVILYSSPHPPIRQKLLNEAVSDSFYRELFMSPCLSGWTKGEEKYNYMILCHQTLSRSQLNSIAKLKEAGIITSNLVTLPKVSNISLANNGVHLSIGSRKLKRLLQSPSSGFGPCEEKYLSDLVVKIVEHFLPLFVGTYSGAPYRLDFHDFHPETVLGFLPHEIDFTHLRMMWRRWRKKARLKILGQPITPFGPKWVDDLIGTVFRLRGDLIPDYRLIDYLTCPMSTEKSPALNGTLGNTNRLKKDLFELGIFDPRMSFYLLYKPRLKNDVGFSGFEGRFYSLFESLMGDMAEAINLQILITALAYKYIFSQEVNHHQIPDDPFIESERRQIFFGSAIGLPTFYIRFETKNLFLKRILTRIKGTRPSRRYPGYIRCHHEQYRMALLELIKKDGAELAETLQMEKTISSLEKRLKEPKELSAVGKLLSGIKEEAGITNPLRVNAIEFNQAAENFYRNTLRKRHIREGFICFKEDLFIIESQLPKKDFPFRETILKIIHGKELRNFMIEAQEKILNEEIPLDSVVRLIQLLLISIRIDEMRSGGSIETGENNEPSPASIY